MISLSRFSSCRKSSVRKIKNVEMESFVIVIIKRATIANHSELTAAVTKCAAREWNACLANVGEWYLQGKLTPSARKIETAIEDCAALRHTASLFARGCCRKTRHVLYHQVELPTA